MIKNLKIEQLRKQFEEALENLEHDLSWNKMDQRYNDRGTRLIWGGYVACAVKNNLVEKIK